MKSIDNLLKQLKREDLESITELFLKVDSLTDVVDENSDANTFLKNALHLVLHNTSEYFKTGYAGVYFRVADKKDKVCFETLNPDGDVLKINADYSYHNDKILEELYHGLDENYLKSIKENAQKFVRIISENPDYDYTMNENNILLIYPNVKHAKTLKNKKGGLLYGDFYFFKIMVNYYYHYFGQKEKKKTFGQYCTDIEVPVSKSQKEKPVFLLDISNFCFPEDYDVKLSPKEEEIVRREIAYLEDYIKVRDELGDGHTPTEIFAELSRRGIHSRVTDEEKELIESKINLPCPFSDYDMLVIDVYRHLISSIIVKANSIYVLKKTIEERNKAYEARLKLEEQIKRYEAVRVQMKRGQEDAHEEKNMLKPIKLGIDMLNETVAKDVWTEEDKKEIKDLTSLVVKSVSKFFEYKKNLARLGNTKKPREDRDFTIDTLIERIQKDYASSLYCKEMQLKTEILQNPTIYADPNVLYDNIFRNIVQNAIEHSKAKNIIIKVEKTTRISLDEKAKEYCLITIQDDGVGMDEQLQKDIFIPLITKNLENKGVGQGGVGCSIALETATLYNGDIEVESKPGEGTAFKIYLPLKETKNE